MTTQASLETIQSLENLFKTWEAWEQNRTYYIHTLLPQLMRNPNDGCAQEKKAIKKIKSIATSEEWSHLEEIAADLPHQKRRIIKASQTLDMLFDKEDFCSDPLRLDTELNEVP